MPDIEGLADQLFTALEGYVERRCSALTKRCEDLERQLLTLPAPKDGKDADEDAIVKRVLEAIPTPKDGVAGPAGQDGKDGDKGDKGDKGEPGTPGKDADEQAIVKRVVAAIPVPKDGERGQDGERGEQGPAGKDADVDTITEAVIARVLATIRVPTDGKDGKDADEGAIVERVLASIPKPKDGERGQDGRDVDPEEMRKAIAKAVAEIPKPTDGRDGRDGMEGPAGKDALEIEFVDLAQNMQRSYVRGTFAKYRGGIMRAVRTTDAVEGDLRAAGWETIVDGCPVLSVDFDGRRTFTISMEHTTGQVETRTFSAPITIDSGVYKPGTKYEQGDGVTWGGSYWIAQRDTSDEQPGTTKAWRLAVRKGTDAK